MNCQEPLRNSLLTLEECEARWAEAGRHGSREARRQRAIRWLPYYAYLAERQQKQSAPLEADPDSFVFRLKSMGRLSGSDTVLDIGAGTGGYSLDFARTCRCVTALDPSRPSLDVLERQAAQAGLGNIRTVEGLWEDYVPEETYDLVFSAMCPAICNVEELRRMESLSRRFCALVAVMPGSYDRHRKAMMAQLGIRPQGGMATEASYYYNALYLMGRRPEVLCRTLHQEYALPCESVLEKYPIYFKLFGVDEKDSLSFLEDYLARNAADGLLQDESRLNFAMITWNVN